MNTVLSVCALCAVAALLALGVVNGEPMRTGAAVEFQSGPVILALAAPGDPVRLVAADGCLRTGCPLIALRVRGAQDETPDRVRLTAL